MRRIHRQWSSIATLEWFLSCVRSPTAGKWKERKRRRERTRERREKSEFNSEFGHMWMSRNRARVWFRFFLFITFYHEISTLPHDSSHILEKLLYCIFCCSNFNLSSRFIAKQLMFWIHAIIWIFFSLFFFTSNSLSVHRLLRSSRSMHSQHCCCIFSFILVYFRSNDSHMLLSTANKLN